MASTGTTPDTGAQAPFAPAKISLHRAGQIATAFVQSKFNRHGFFDPEHMSPRSPGRDTWIVSKSEQTGLNTAQLTKYVAQVVNPALRGTRITNPPTLLTLDEVGEISLRLFYLECTNMARIGEQVQAFETSLPSLIDRGLCGMFSHEEIVSLVTYYAVPHHIQILTRWDQDHIGIVFYTE